MVYIHIPDILTEEENMLMAKYAKLKKKKKQVQALKIKPEVEKPSILLKRPKDARDAKEVARKLIKSGNINIPKTETQSEVKFKRPNISQERKKAQNEATTYHPFASTSEEDRTVKPQEKTETPTEGSAPVTPTAAAGGNRAISFLYQQIADDDNKKQQPSVQQREKKSGFTVYVAGKSIDEDFLKKNFTDFGMIVNISMEIEKGNLT